MHLTAGHTGSNQSLVGSPAVIAYNHCLTSALYIANRPRWKSFVVAKLNYNLLENILGWTVVLYGQSLLNELFHWKSFTAPN